MNMFIANWFNIHIIDHTPTFVLNRWGATRRASMIPTWRNELSWVSSSILSWLGDVVHIDNLRAHIHRKIGGIIHPHLIKVLDHVLLQFKDIISVVHLLLIAYSSWLVLQACHFELLKYKMSVTWIWVVMTVDTLGVDWKHLTLLLFTLHDALLCQTEWLFAKWVFVSTVCSFSCSN